MLHTPSGKAAKNWISQGYTAERGVVIADLIVDGDLLRDSVFIKTIEVSRGTLACDALLGAGPCNAPCNTTFRRQNLQRTVAPLY